MVLRLNPAYKDYIWGGSRLVREFGKVTSFEKVAESWELSCHKNGECTVSGAGYDGCTLSSVIAATKASGVDILGERCKKFADFPLLVKLIDANMPLSVQVHPNDEYARRVENGYGKCEVWYVVSAEEGARLVYGFSHDVTKEEVRAAIEKNELEGYLNFVPVKSGDVFFVEPGKIHAIGGGILICEIQQSSDTTYRVYDWGRVDANGKSRELHIGKALDVISFVGERECDFSPALLSVGDGVREFLVAECEYFRVKKVEQKKNSTVLQNGESFASITVLSGSGCIKSAGECLEFSRGDSFFISAEEGEYTLLGECEYLISRV